MIVFLQGKGSGMDSMECRAVAARVGRARRRRRCSGAAGRARRRPAPPQAPARGAAAAARHAHTPRRVALRGIQSINPQIIIIVSLKIVSVELQNRLDKYPGLNSYSVCI